GAVARGSAVEIDPTTAWLMMVRLAAVVLLVVALTGVAHRSARRGLAVATALFLAGLLLRSADQPTTANVLAGLGGLAVAATAALGARRSIAARIAAASTALLLVVVVVLSAVLSVVLSGNISREALRRAEDLAGFRADSIARQADEAAGQADVVATILQGSEPFRAAVRANSYDAMGPSINALLSIYRQVDFIAFIDTAGGVRVGAGTSDAEVVELSGTQVARDGISGNAAASVDIVGGGLIAMGAIPVSVTDARGAPQLVGAAVTGSRIDQGLLRELLQNERGTALSVLVRDRVVATTADVSAASIRDVVGRSIATELDRVVLSVGRPLSAEAVLSTGDSFVAVAPITTSDDRPVAAFAVANDAELVDATLTSLFRTLFLVALGATAGAFILATVMGARVAAPLRRLTTAAERIASGDLTARAEVEAEDEIGTLGGSFDTMTASIERMTREIREAAAQTAAILGGMAEGLVATAPDGTIVALNAAAEQLLGVREGRALDKPVEAVIKGTDATGRPLADRLGASLTKPWSMNGTLARRRGPLAVAMSGAPIRDERGTLVGRVYVMRDIQREAEVEAMKSEFLANISHELRTPLTPIKGYTEMMLARDVPKSRQKAFLTTILESTERLERYVDMLVNFSAMEAGRFELQTAEVDVHELCRRVADRWKATKTPHTFACKPAARVPKVLADERLLERVMNELVDNAVKYSPDGGKVEIATRVSGTGAARRVEVSVTDRGIGIQPADLDAIFSDFSQLDGSSTRKFGGLGLGLSFVNRVVQAHQGVLEATSTPGEGSTFTISLPPMSDKPARRSRPAATPRRAAPAARRPVSKRRPVRKGGRR
ncbi:MAG TPA: ATP-binding protein, partial [Acidimicrobiia bacterium]|nr:ATP-binding protein [Acidimicrobiia bacterium]